MKNNILKQTTSKRHFLKGLTALIGASAVAQLTAGNALASALNYQANASEGPVEGKLFNQIQMQQLRAICQTVIPETDTPSAAQLDVHGFIDHQLLTCYRNVHHEAIKQLLGQIDSLCLKEYKKGFLVLEQTQQVQILEDLESALSGFSKADSEDFRLLKYLIVFGYFTTEVGATQVLAYQAIPGGFKGSIPYESVGKSYGSLAYY